MAGRRTTYVRDGNGRFASTPGGRSSSRGKSLTRGRTALVRARQSVRQAQRKLAAFDPADESIKASLSKRAQRGAVTRAQKQLKAVAKTSIIRAPRQAGVISKARRRAASAPKASPVKAAAPAAAPVKRPDRGSSGSRRESKRNISDAKAARIIARIDANRPALRRASGSDRRTRNALQTHDRASAFVQAASGRARRRGTPIDLAESVRRAVRNAKAKPAPAKPAAAPAAAASKPKPKARAKAAAVVQESPTTAMPPKGRSVPASQRPGSVTSTLRDTLQALAKADAARIREIERITGQPVRAPRKPTAGAGATVRAPGRRSVSGTLGDNLRSLAQSDARTAREMADLAKPAPKGALKGGKSTSRKQVKPKARAKAPAAAPAPAPAPVKSAAPRRGRVRGARPAGTIAKPKGLKPGALAARMKARQTTPSTRRPNPRAERAKAAANRTGVVKGKNFTHGQDVKTMSLAELRTAVRQHARQGGPMSRKEFMFMYALPSGVVTTGRNGMEQGRMPRTRGDWEKIYKDVIGLPQAERNRKDRPGVINGIDIHGSFRPGAVFGLSMKTATADDVNRAYRRLARQHHPDAGGRRRDFERLTQMRDSMLALMRSDFGSGKGKAKGKGNGKGKGAAAAPAAAAARGPRLLPPASTPVRSAAAAPKARARSAAAPTATAGKPKTKTQAARSPSGSKRQTTVQRYIDMRRRIAAIGSGRTGVKAENSRKVRARAEHYAFSLFVRTQGRLPNFSPNATPSSQDRLAVKRIKKTAEAVYGRTEAAKKKRESAATMGGTGRPSAISRSQRGRNGKGDKVSAPAPAPAQMRVLRGDTPRRIRGARPAGTIAKVTARNKAPTQASAKSTRTVYRTKTQATRAQRERNRQLAEFGQSASGRSGTGKGRSIRRRSVRVSQGNLLTGRIDSVVARTSASFGPSRIGQSAASKRTAQRRARAEARYDALLQERKSIMGKRGGRIKSGELARNSQRMGAVAGAFRVYDMGTGRRPPRRRTGGRVRNSGDRN